MAERFFLFSSESERSDGSGGPDWEYIAPAPAVPVGEYIAPAPAVRVGEYIAPAPAVPVMEYIAPTPAVPVGEYIAPAPAVPVGEYIAPAPGVPVGEYIAPAPAVYAAPAPVVEDIASATPVVEYIASVPTSTPAVSSPPATCVQSRQSAHRVSTEVPTVSSRHHHDELFRAERVLRARAARQGYLFRQMKRRDTQLAAQLTSLGKACEVVRGSPVASLLVPVAMREQGLFSKLLVFEKQLEDHEVAVLELERQVAVLEVGENFKQLSDLVHEAKALEGERQVAVEKLEAHFQRLSDRVNETKALVRLFDDQIANTKRAFSAEVKGTSLAVAEFGVALQKSGRDFGELASFVDALGRLHDVLREKVLHVDQQVMKLVEWSDGITTNLNDIVTRVDNLEQWGEELAQSL